MPQGCWFFLCSSCAFCRSQINEIQFCHKNRYIKLNVCTVTVVLYSWIISRLTFKLNDTLLLLWLFTNLLWWFLTFIHLTVNLNETINTPKNHMYTPTNTNTNNIFQSNTKQLLFISMSARGLTKYNKVFILF